MSDTPISPFAGKPCKECGAPLRVTRVEPTDFKVQGGGTFAASEYECEGNPPHRYAERSNLPVSGGQIKIILVRTDDEPEA